MTGNIPSIPYSYEVIVNVEVEMIMCMIYGTTHAYWIPEEESMSVRYIDLA